jgi:hypothetical protein
MTDKEFEHAIDEFKAASTNPAAMGTSVCSVYQKVRPILTGILPFLKLIPKFGETIAAALTALMAALDEFCKTAPAPSAAKA